MTFPVADRMANVRRTLIRRIFDAAPAGAINLGLGQPDLGTPAVAAEAGIAAIRAGRTGYGPTAGIEPLRRAIADLHPEHPDGVEGVVVTVGSQEALFASLMAIVDPGDEILIPDPGYPAYPTVARLVGAVPVTYPLRPDRGFRIDPHEVLAHVGPRTRAILVCSPSNPTGAVHPTASLETLGRGIERAGIAWISDEVYAGYCYDGPLPTLRAVAPGSGVSIGGVSKDASMTGWRIGWAVGPRDVVSKITAVHQHLVTCASTISQEAALGALSAGGRKACRSIADRFASRRTLMGEELSRVPGVRADRPDGAFYYFPAIEGCRDSEALALRILEEAGVITIPGVAFGPGGEGRLRLSFAASEDDIVRGVRAIAAVLGRSRP